MSRAQAQTESGTAAPETQGPPPGAPPRQTQILSLGAPTPEPAPRLRPVESEVTYLTSLRLHVSGVLS